jgi:hypothetical protein
MYRKLRQIAKQDSLACDLFLKTQFLFGKH